MTKKIYNLFLFSSLLLSSIAGYSQEEKKLVYKGNGYDFADTSLIPNNRKPQQQDFLANQYDFPAKPRSQWELGISGGVVNVSGDVRSKSIFNHPQKAINTLGWDIHLRKAWGYVISTRLQFMHGIASGYNYQESEGYWGHASNPWQMAGYTQDVYYNYKTTMSELSLELVANLNNLKFHKARNKVSYYVFAGTGGLLYNVMIDAKDKNKNNANYDFIAITTSPNHIYDSRKTIDKQLRDLFDGEYETNAERHENAAWSGKNTYRTILNLGVGLQYRLSKNFTLQIEEKVTHTGDDLVDGQRWQERPRVSSTTVGAKTSSSLTRDFDNINYVSIGINMHIGNHSVEPLWWMNPVDYSYNGLSRPVAHNAKCETDTDGDGIADCFDTCNDTPSGVSVDSHGCPMDIDGDGIADYKDKQLITPTDCQPSDADGVGKCPDPACCGLPMKVSGCGNVANGSIQFLENSSFINVSAKSQLDNLAASMRSNPDCKVVFVGNGNGNKVEQQRSWDRVNGVINYLVDKLQIDRERFIFRYGQAGLMNSVEYHAASAGEDGPSNVPPPHPNIKLK